MRCNRIDFSDRFELCAAIESTFWIAILEQTAYHSCQPATSEREIPDLLVKEPEVRPESLHAGHTTAST